eukprot:1513235-Alexandrium_andersonii.AAC.1
MRQAWGEVTTAKGRTPADAVEFCERYPKYLVRGQEPSLQAITSEMLQRATRRNPHNAGGADLWTPEQLSWASVEAAAP